MGRKTGPGQTVFKVEPQVPAKRSLEEQSYFDVAKTRQFSVRWKDNQIADEARSALLTSPRTLITFKSHKTVNGFTQRRDKGSLGETERRPHTSRYPMNKAHMRLNTRQPLATNVSLDAWSLIFKRCHPKFLMNARLVCRSFLAILEQDSIWREARAFTYGPLLPGCPYDVSEIAFTKLLVGRGCQAGQCTQIGTKKIHWPWMRRLCEQCFYEQTLPLNSVCEEANRYVELRNTLEIEVQDTLPKHLSGLLPAVSVAVGTYMQPRAFDTEAQMWRFQGKTHNCRMLKIDFEELRKDFSRKVMHDASYFLFWARLRWGSTKTRAVAAIELDDYGSVDELGTYRYDKTVYFRDMAKQLDPPMHSTILGKMLAFHRAVDTSNSASPRAWDGLKARIDHDDLREQAKQLVDWDRESMEPKALGEKYLSDRLAQHRCGDCEKGEKRKRFTSFPPELRFVLRIAQRELAKLLDKVHDEDLLLMLLDRVHTTFEASTKKPIGLNGDGTEGPYRLLLDDARKVVSEVLTPLAMTKGAARSRRITHSLQCMACTRPTCKRLFPFETLLQHVRKRHSIYVGKNLHYWRLATPVESQWHRFTQDLAWHQVLWPKSLPALPGHRRAAADLQWNPDEVCEYIQHPEQRSSDLFENAEPIVPPDVEMDQFEDFFTYAVGILSCTRLDSTCTFKLALEYAKHVLSQNSILGEKHSSFQLDCPQLQSLQKALRKVSSSYELRFKCALCMSVKARARKWQQPREVVYTQSLTMLMRHWKKKHKLAVEQDKPELVYIPSDSELLKAIQTEEEKLETEKRKATLMNLNVNPVLPDNACGRSNDPRADAVLKIPMIGHQIRVLFSPVELEDAEDSVDGTSDAETED